MQLCNWHYNYKPFNGTMSMLFQADQRASGGRLPALATGQSVQAQSELLVAAALRATCAFRPLRRQCQSTGRLTTCPEAAPRSSLSSRWPAACPIAHHRGHCVSGGQIFLYCLPGSRRTMPRRLSSSTTTATVSSSLQMADSTSEPASDGKQGNSEVRKIILCTS